MALLISSSESPGGRQGLQPDGTRSIHPRVNLKPQAEDGGTVLGTTSRIARTEYWLQRFGPGSPGSGFQDRLRIHWGEREGMVRTAQTEAVGRDDGAQL